MNQNRTIIVQPILFAKRIKNSIHESRGEFEIHTNEIIACCEVWAEINLYLIIQITTMIDYLIRKRTWASVCGVKYMSNLQPPQ